MRRPPKKLGLKRLKPVNPFCTGGGGQRFEWLVAASYVVNVLRQDFVRGTQAVASGVRLQQRNQGHPVDDIAVEGLSGSTPHLLYLQAKHRISFSKNRLFSEVISAAWGQFNNRTFKRGIDVIGLAIGEACNDKFVRDHVMDVLSWAKTTNDADGYYQQIKGFPHKSKALKAFENALRSAAGRKLNRSEAHAFLRHFVVIPFDFDLSTGRDSVICWNQLRESVESNDARHAKSLMDLLLAMCMEYAPNAGTITRDALAARIAERTALRVPALQRSGPGLMQLLQRQARNRVTAEKNSKKYIPNVFVEITDIKDTARLFCHPALFLQQLEDDIRRFNLRGLNRMLNKAGLTSLTPDIPKGRVAKGDFKSVTTDADRLARGVQSLLDAVSSLVNSEGLQEARARVPENKREAFDHMTPWLEQGAYGLSDRRLPKLLRRLRIAKARVIAIISRAGQGKTNFVCDLVEHFVLPREIPCALFTGRELRGVRRGELCQHLARTIYFSDPTVDVRKFLAELEGEAAKKGVSGMIVIDALNEHDDLHAFSAEVETLIELCMDYEHLRVLVTCRSEYFEARFGNLQASSFGDRMVVEREIHNQMGSEHKRRLLWGYLDFFRIKCSISKSAYGKLTSDPFLLRLFCEAYGNPDAKKLITIGYVRTICKDDLFRKYLNKKLAAAAQKTNRQTGFLVGGKHPYEKLLMTVVEWMISRRSFANVPVESFGRDDLGTLTQLIDEDIFLRKDLSENAKDSSGQKEIISFTFDEFRDFLLADYLLTTVLHEDAQHFERLVRELTQPTCSVSEGVSQYLFFGSRYIENDTGLTILKKQPWYDRLFVPCVFELDDAMLKAEDIEKIRQTSESENQDAVVIFAYLMWRYDTNSFRNANIELLFDILDQHSEDAFRRLLYRMFDQSPFSARQAFYPLSTLTEHLRPLVLAQGAQWEKSFAHLARLLLYLWDARDAKYSWLARELFMEFSQIHPSLAQELCEEHIRHMRKGYTGAYAYNRPMTDRLGVNDGNF